MKNIIMKIIKSLGIFLLIFFAFMAPYIWSDSKAYWYKNHPTTFEQSIWHTAENENNAHSTYIRLKMASDLVKSGALINKSEIEIVSLLGKPQNHPSVQGSAYWLAPYDLDSMWLQIIYEQGIAKYIAIVHD